MGLDVRQSVMKEAGYIADDDELLTDRIEWKSADRSTVNVKKLNEANILPPNTNNSNIDMFYERWPRHDLSRATPSVRARFPV